METRVIALLCRKFDRHGVRRRLVSLQLANQRLANERLEVVAFLLKQGLRSLKII